MMNTSLISSNRQNGKIYTYFLRRTVSPPFDIRELRELMETDDLELDTLGDRKTALFVIISDTDDTFVRPDRAFCIADYWYCSA